MWLVTLKSIEMRNDDGGEHIFCYTVPDQRSPICGSDHAGPSGHPVRGHFTTAVEPRVGDHCSISMICSLWPSHSAGSSSLTTTREPPAANPDLLKKMEVECVLKESTACFRVCFVPDAVPHLSVGCAWYCSSAPLKWMWLSCNAAHNL